MRRAVLMWWGIGAMLAALALGAALTAAGPDLPSVIDRAWNAWMIDLRAPVTLGIGYALNRLGGGWIATILVPALAIGALLVIRRRRAAVLAAAALLASVVAVQLLKSVFGRARPIELLVPSDFGSFPSGHTANAATLAVLAILLFPRLWVVLAGIAWTLLMAFSRTALSVHWFSDTIGGILVGAGMTLIVGGFLLAWVRRTDARRAGGRRLGDAVVEEE